MDTTLGYEKYNRDTNSKTNYRNGYSHKKVNTNLGEIEIDVPRDRNAEFDQNILLAYFQILSPFHVIYVYFFKEF
uniref:transposase n=1 Tax=Vallitalea okinawensis TaxID=2078660 RepID=UPI001478CEF0